MKASNYGRDPHGHRWGNPALLQFCIHYRSVSALHCARRSSGMPIPSPATIYRQRSHISPRPGIHIDVVAEFAAAMRSRQPASNGYAELIPVCAILFDEIHIRPGIEFATNDTYLHGFCFDPFRIRKEDVLKDESAAGRLKATQILQVLLVGIFNNYEFPLCFVPTNQCTSEYLNELFHQILNSLHVNGIIPLTVVCDGGIANRKLFKDLGAMFDAKTETFSGVIRNPLNGLPIFLCQDFVHVLKKLRNSLHSRKEMVRLGEAIRWSHVVDAAYYLEEHPDIYAKLRPRDVHLDPNNKMRVQLALNVFNNTVKEVIAMLHTDGSSKGTYVCYVSVFCLLIYIKKTAIIMTRYRLIIQK